jgi:hypothetical protein
MHINDSILSPSRRTLRCIALLLGFAGAMPACAATAADLAVSNLTALPASVSVNGNLTLLATVSNTGGTTSNASTLRYFRATDTQRSNETQVCDATIAPLAVAESSAPPCSLSAPSATGTYYFFACVDADGSESNTANNCTGTSAVNVTAANPGCQTSPLTAQQSSNGTLTATDCHEDLSDGSTYYYDPYEFSGTAGQQVTLRLASTQFDPYVLVKTPAGDDGEDDNSGGGTTAQLTLTLVESGKLVFHISSAFPLQSGAYALSFSVLDAPLAADPVIEFYHSGLDHYFITANAAEASGLDSNPNLGWKRTGNSFASGGHNAVCRFYGSMSPGPNSHFYTVDATECAELKALQASTPDSAKRWNFESLDFRSTPPVARACPSGLQPIYRAYNNGYARGVDSNHRMSAHQSAIQEVVARGWIDEGIVMCAPL